MVMENRTQFAMESQLDGETGEFLKSEDSGSNPVAEPNTMFTKNEIVVWTWLVSRGIANALSGLSRMVKCEINVTSLNLEQLSTKDATDLLGGPGALGIGIYLTIHGDASGHLLLVHDPEIAFQLIDIQMDLPAGSTQRIGEMERSVLGEMGNVTGGFFLNTLADMTGLSLLPSPPSVIVDTVGAILSIPLDFLMDKQEEALAVKTTFSAGTRQIHGTFLILPTVEFMKTVLCSQNILR